MIQCRRKPNLLLPTCHSHAHRTLARIEPEGTDCSLFRTCSWLVGRSSLETFAALYIRGFGGEMGLSAGISFMTRKIRVCTWRLLAWIRGESMKDSMIASLSRIVNLKSAFSDLPSSH
jgi:hypothetical protein